MARVLQLISTSLGCTLQLMKFLPKGPIRRKGKKKISNGTFGAPPGNGGFFLPRFLALTVNRCAYIEQRMLPTTSLADNISLLNKTQSLEVLRGVMSDHNRCLAGIVSSRTCPLCGHHEVGLAAADGGFYPLKPGMAIRIVAPLPEGVDSLKTAPVRQALPPEEVEEYTPWVPDPVMSYRALRLKYGVKVRADRIGKTMSPEIYRAAYLDKLRELIVREVYVPLPVILDRFFTAWPPATPDRLQKQCGEN